MSRTEAPRALLDAFAAYEAALMANDLAALDALFADEPTTLRGDAAGLLVGHDQISAFRAGRGGAPARRLIETHAQVIDADHVLIVAITELVSGGRSQQTQLWVRTPGVAAYDGWQVAAAHVSVPAPALDTRIWRVVGDPLALPTSSGPLDGEAVAVKDLFAMAGGRVGAGNPTWLGAAPIETTDAEAVASLRAAGASVRGIARTDEFAYSLAGTNDHYGTPPNPKAPFRIPGGSSSGCASAIALGHATIGLGTDTGGSIRVPASYQGLFGMRTTHGVVSRNGVLPLAPSFDTVGWLTRDPDLLQTVGEVLLPPGPIVEPTALVSVPALTSLASDEVAAAVEAWCADFAEPERWPYALEHLDSWLAAFQTVQAHEAWESHGSWLQTRLGSLGPDVRSRFERARDISDADATAARATVQSAQDAIREWIGDRALAVPAAATVAPYPASAGAARDATMRLTCLAGLAGLPAVTLPMSPSGRLPIGVCVLAAPGRDLDLLRFAADAAE